MYGLSANKSGRCRELDVREREKSLNKSQCMDFLPKTSGCWQRGECCGGVAISGGWTVLLKIFYFEWFTPERIFLTAQQYS